MMRGTFASILGCQGSVDGMLNALRAFFPRALSADNVVIAHVSARAASFFPPAPLQSGLWPRVFFEDCSVVNIVTLHGVPDVVLGVTPMPHESILDVVSTGVSPLGCGPVHVA